jgi:hypothetical protein
VVPFQQLDTNTTTLVLMKIFCLVKHDLGKLKKTRSWREPRRHESRRIGSPIRERKKGGDSELQ